MQGQKYLHSEYTQMVQILSNYVYKNENEKVSFRAYSHQERLLLLSLWSGPKQRLFFGLVRFLFTLQFAQRPRI